jgi:alkanesulfonate monooxygenase SsuD/methylene tetrahydromethanopterin reductase-like flavin-dependent oxidoreductase (luciferase family)
MKFAHFSHVWAKPGMTPHERYEQLWRELALCDEVGFDYAFCVEHHFRPDESWMSSPSLYAVGAGARTERLRVGPMGYIVPLYHPLRLAEEIAIVDQMLGGRLELGLVPASTRIISVRSVSIMPSANRRPWNSSVICARLSARSSRSRSTAKPSIPTPPNLRCRRCSGRIRRSG